MSQHKQLRNFVPLHFRTVIRWCSWSLIIIGADLHILQVWVFACVSLTDVVQDTTCLHYIAHMQWIGVHFQQQSPETILQRSKRVLNCDSCLAQSFIESPLHVGQVPSVSVWR